MTEHVKRKHRQNRPNPDFFFAKLWEIRPRFGFFGLPDWPGLGSALAQRPVGDADVDLWGRASTLWRGGQWLDKRGDQT